MNRLSLATWNINSVRLRIDRVVAFLKREKADVLCLQEIKCLDDQFPRKAFEAAGYRHIHLSGQKGMHGVAIVSKLPIEPLETPGLCRHGHARCAAVKVAGFEVQNLYVPAGAASITGGPTSGRRRWSISKATRSTPKSAAGRNPPTTCP